MRGYLYVLTNPNMRGLVKIGYTERSPQERAAELSRATGVPGRFKVEKSWLIDQAQAHEREVHAALAAHRASGEHYRLTVSAAVEPINVMLRAGGIIGDDGLTAVERAQAAARAAEEAKRAAEAKRRAAEAAANVAEREAAQPFVTAQETRRWERVKRRMLIWSVTCVGLFIVLNGSVEASRPYSHNMTLVFVVVGMIWGFGMLFANAVDAPPLSKADSERRDSLMAEARARVLGASATTPPLSKAEQSQPGSRLQIEARTRPLAAQPEPRFIVTHGDLYGDRSRYILLEVPKREIVFRSDNKSKRPARDARLGG
jgi:hypothetical protein